MVKAKQDKQRRVDRKVHQRNRRQSNKTGAKQAVLNMKVINEGRGLKCVVLHFLELCWLLWVILQQLLGKLMYYT